ncbi:hypothetical protein BMS3Abin04_00486 [bacterium BMS3Abin04]|nr:hypothetical protein BMS3Abin04_00486 [bacterium BMS3Abin04]
MERRFDIDKSYYLLSGSSMSNFTMAALNATAVPLHTLLDNKLEQYNFFDIKDVILLLNDDYYFYKDRITTSIFAVLFKIE